MRKQIVVAFAMLLASLIVAVAWAQEPQPQPPTWNVTNLQQILSFALIFTGLLARGLLPYLRKWLADENIGFQKRYIAIMIASFVTAWIAYPQFSVAFTSWWQLLTASFIFGFGLQATYTEAYAILTTEVKPTTSPTPA